MWAILSVWLLMTGTGEKEIPVDTLREKYVSSEVKLIGTVYGLDARYKGNIKVSDDDRMVTYITPGGYIEIKKTTFGNTKELLIESDIHGNLGYSFFDNRNEKPFVPEGQQFLLDVLPEVIEISDVAALNRLNRFLREGGIDKALREIRIISSSSNQSTYYSYLLEKKGLNGSQLSKIGAEIGKNISSSSEQGQLFRRYAYKFLSSETSTESYFYAVMNISSSSEQGAVLRAVLDQPGLSEKSLKELLITVNSISSSAERGAVLRVFHNKYINASGIRDAYFDAISQISSSSEQGFTLRHLIDEKELDVESQILLFKIIAGISSSHEKGVTIRHMAKQLIIKNDAVMDAFLEAINSISSSAEKGETLRQIFSSIDPNHTASLEEIFDVIANISSSAEQGHTLRFLIDQAGKNQRLMEALLKVTAEISSSSEQAQVLVKAAPFVKENARLRDIYSQTARSISSDFEYRKVMEALN